MPRRVDDLRGRLDRQQLLETALQHRFLSLTRRLAELQGDTS